MLWEIVRQGALLSFAGAGMMLLLPEGEFSSPSLSRRPSEGVWAAVWAPPSLLPRNPRLLRREQWQQKGLSSSVPPQPFPGEKPVASP